MIFLEAMGGMKGLGELIFAMLFGPAIVFTVIGFIFSRFDNKKVAKVMYILAVVYMIVSLGICGGLVGGF